MLELDEPDLWGVCCGYPQPVRLLQHLYWYQENCAPIILTGLVMSAGDLGHVWRSLRLSQSFFLAAYRHQLGILPTVLQHVKLPYPTISVKCPDPNYQQSCSGGPRPSLFTSLLSLIYRPLGHEAPGP